VETRFFHCFGHLIVCKLVLTKLLAKFVILHLPTIVKDLNTESKRINQWQYAEPKGSFRWWTFKNSEIQSTINITKKINTQNMGKVTIKTIKMFLQDDVFFPSLLMVLCSLWSEDFQILCVPQGRIHHRTHGYKCRLLKVRKGKYKGEYGGCR
jgi:hypothetical protein